MRHFETDLGIIISDYNLKILRLIFEVIIPLFREENRRNLVRNLSRINTINFEQNYGDLFINLCGLISDLLNFQNMTFCH